MATTDRLEIILDANVSRFEQGFGGSIRTANEFDDVIRRMTKGMFGFSEAGGVFVDSANKQARVYELLSGLGIRRSKEIEQEITVLKDLAGSYSNDAFISAQFAEKVEVLERRLGKTNTTALAGGRVFLNLSRIIQGSTGSVRQMTSSMLPMIRNIGLMRREAKAAGTTIKSLLIGSLVGGGGLALVVAATTVALKLFEKAEKDVKDEGADLAKELDNVASGFLRIDSAVPKLRKLTLDQSRAFLEDFEVQAESLSATLFRLRGTGLPLSKELEASLEEQIEDAETLTKQFRLIVRQEETRVRIADRLKDLGVEDEKTKRKSLNILEQEVANTAKLRATVTVLAGMGAQRLARQEALNRALQTEINIRRMGADPSQRLDPRGLDAPLPGTQLRTFTDAQIEESTRLADANREALDRMSIDWGAYLIGTAEGLDMLQSLSTTTFGGFAELARGAYQIAGERAGAYFTLFKGFAIAEGIANTYVAATKALAQGGIFGAVLAAGVIASVLGYVAQIAAASPGGGGGGGGGSGGGGVGGSRFDPFTGSIIPSNQGLLGSNRNRVLAPFASAPAVQVVVLETRIEGNDIVLAQRRTIRRQNN